MSDIDIKFQKISKKARNFVKDIYVDGKRLTKIPYEEISKESLFKYISSTVERSEEIIREFKNKK